MKYKSQYDSLFMHICLTDTETVNDEDDIEIIEANILAPNFATPNADTSCIKEIFAAMNTCADLHPGTDDSEDGGEEDETAPGATGWITADNMDEFLDENGNFRGQVYGEESEDLGPGAGTVRPREEEQDNRTGVNGADDTKWQRTG
jgi:nucleotide-sensitive chloride channel 1A